MVKTIECGVLSRWFGADTHGFIPSLRDYWDIRYKAGLQIMKIYTGMRSADITWTMSKPAATGRSNLRLPHHYPRVD